MDLELRSQCSHSNSLVAGPYPIPSTFVHTYVTTSWEQNWGARYCCGLCGDEAGAPNELGSEVCTSTVVAATTAAIAMLMCFGMLGGGKQE
jgi:hypothetical protein